MSEHYTKAHIDAMAPEIVDRMKIVAGELPPERLPTTLNGGGQETLIHLCIQAVI